MAEQTSKTLNHFSFFRFTNAYYGLDKKQKETLHKGLINKLEENISSFDIYQVYPATIGSDIMIWTTVEADAANAAHSFFTEYAQITNNFREILEPVHALWGFTKPSQYTKKRSAQEIDPFAKQRSNYLVIYPFAKTGDWYLMSAEARQGMMNEHIRIGKEFLDIKQLLLYSFGLQDQEFVVVYETDDLNKFSELVYDLRNTEARRYTAMDAPLFTAIYHKPKETLALWSTNRSREPIK